MSKKALLKLVVLALFLIASVIVVSLPETRAFLTHENLSAELDALGPWAAVAYVVVYAVLITLTLPGTIVTVAGAALFPLGEAFVLTIVGAMVGATSSFWISRCLGRGAVQEFLSDDENQSKIREKMGLLFTRFENNGTMAIAYLRIAYVPFSLLNYTAPLTGVTFRQFTIGTFLGILPGTFIFVFLGNTLSEAWKQGNWGALWTWQLPVALALFAASLALPKWLKQFENRSNTTRNT